MLKWVIIVLAVVWIIAMWSILIYAFVRGWRPYIHSKRQKKSSVRAKVKEKQGNEEYSHIHERVDIADKTLVFACEDGIEREFEVHDDVFDYVEVGDAGMLVYQGHLFVDFDGDRQKHDLDKLYKKYTRT